MKYIGSKNRIAYDILPIMLDGMKPGDTFVDAFCGGKLILGGSDMTMDVYPDYDEESIMYY